MDFAELSHEEILSLYEQLKLPNYSEEEIRFRFLQTIKEADTHALIVMYFSLQDFVSNAKKEMAEKN